ncbi:MAG: hypothetical protein WBD31_32740 [Rubripirellula sp.]
MTNRFRWVFTAELVLVFPNASLSLLMRSHVGDTRQMQTPFTPMKSTLWYIN